LETQRHGEHGEKNKRKKNKRKKNKRRERKARRRGGRREKKKRTQWEARRGQGEKRDMLAMLDAGLHF
jgi:hypothetical protein